MRRILLLLVAALVAAAQTCNTGLPNNTLPANGNVCDLLHEPTFVRTLCSLSITSGLQAALDACADDTDIEITLSPSFSDTGPFIFPNVMTIIVQGSNASTLFGVNNVALGNTTALTFIDVRIDGQGSEELWFKPLRCNNVTLINVRAYRFHGKKMIAQEGCDAVVSLQADDSLFFDVWGASLLTAGLYSSMVRSNVFARSGGNGYGAVVIKSRWGVTGPHVFFNNTHYLLFDEQPPLCIAFLDGGEHLRCREGIFECEDLTATVIANDCPRDINKTFVDPMTNETVWEMLFQPYCRRYAPCQCDEVFFRDVSNVSVSDFSLRVGDVIYPHVTLPCVPGDVLVAGGAVGSVAPLAIKDPSFELGNNAGPAGWTTSGNDVILDNSVSKPKSRTGSRRVICNGKQDEWFEQNVNFNTSGAYLLSFWGARRDDQRNNFGGGFVELYLDGVQQVSIGEPSFFNTLVADLTYYEFLFPPINVAVPGVKTMRIRCNFVDTQNLEFAIDDVSSRESGLVITSFPPGQGIGPPPLADPKLYIALPLTYDAYIEPLLCPGCPNPPERPLDIPCDYVIDPTFTCFDTIFNGTRLCLEPGLFNSGSSGTITDPSMEQNNTWTTVQGAPAIIVESGPLFARTGTHLLYVNNFGIVAIQQVVNFTESTVARLRFSAARNNPNIVTYQGKLIKLYIDGILVSTLTFTEIQATLFAPSVYLPLDFAPQAVSAGPHTLRIQLDWSGGPFASDLMVDDIQFLTTGVSASATRTPSPSPSLLPSNNTITVLCGGHNVTVVCAGANTTLNCSGTNTTFSCYPAPSPPPTQLRCVEQRVYLGDKIFTGGCIVPGSMMVPYGFINVTANECVTRLWETCRIPETYSFTLDGSLVTCMSLQIGFMQCDCSSNKLAALMLNRTITPGTCAYEFDNIQEDSAGFFIRNNRAQQLDFGGCSRRISYDTVVNSSVTPADYFDERAVGREILKQSNMLWGRIPDPSSPSGVRNGPRFLQDALARYEAICEDNCPQFNPTVPGTNIAFCIVDPTGADYVGSGTNGIYATIQEAIDDPKCGVVWVRESENFYEEDLVFKRDNIILFINDGATVIGTASVRGDVNALFIRGIIVAHNGRNGQPWLDIDDASDLRNLTLMNCDISCNGVKDAGLIRNRGRTITNVVMIGNKIRNCQTTSLRFDAVNIVVEHNTLIDCSGRLMQARYQGTVRSQHNKYIDSRGAPDIKKPAMFEFTYIGRRDNAPCNSDPSACAVRRNIQVETEDPFTSPDYKETAILLRGGSFYLDSISDNVCVKARTGIRARKVDFITTPETLASLGANSFLEVLQKRNAACRVTHTRREKDGEDFMIDGFADGSRFSAISCSFPNCVPPDRQPRYCIANLNFDSFYSEEYAWETYTNTSHAAFYCVLPVINVTVFGGARIIPERIDIWRPHSNDIVRPLIGEPSNEDILLGDAPVPDRFTIRGVPTSEELVPLFARLLDANTTYGFGDGERVFLHTDLICTCPAINVITGQPVNFVATNCTDIIGPFQNTSALCEEAAAGDVYSACTVAPESALDCSPSGQFVQGQVLVLFYDCQLPVSLVIVTNGTNGTLVYTNETRFIVRTLIKGNPGQCVLETRDIFGLVFSQGTLNLCETPTYYTTASTFRALNISWESVNFALYYGPTLEDFEIEAPMLASVEPVIDLRFRDVHFDGQRAAVPARMEAVKMQVGLDVPETLGRKQRNQRPPVFSRVRFQRCTFTNFVYFETILGNSAGSANELSEMREFPAVNALDVEFVNTLATDDTNFILDDVVFEDIDRTALRIRGARNILIKDSHGRRTGGRSPDTPATYWVEGNSRAPNTVIHFKNTNFTQTREVTDPYLADQTVPGYAALVVVTGLSDTALDDCTQLENATIDQCLSQVYPSCCPKLIIESAFWCGLPVGLRLLGERGPMSRYIMDSITDITGTPPLYTDELAALRELAMFNDVSIDGTVCDIVLGPPTQDWEEENLCCKESCPPKTPAACRVNSSDVSIVPANPWYDVYWFSDLNRAMQMCQAPSRRINLEAAADPYQVRITADVMQPAVLNYVATWSGPVTITVLSTFPISGLESPPAVTIPIDWTDSTPVPISVELVTGAGVVAPMTVEITGSLQMPPHIQEAVPAETPPQWLMDISIRLTFCTPNNTAAPVSSFVFPEFAYTSPPINVNTPSFDYAAMIVVSWQWSARASLQTQTGLTVHGVGWPPLECNGHTPQGSNITVEDVHFMHGDPCVDSGLDPITCPCTVPGLATWEQQDSRPAPGLRLVNNRWDGRNYVAWSIAGEFWGRAEVKRSTFTDYRGSYVVRVAPSATEDCCTNACRNEFVASGNTFMGADGVSLTGNLIYLGPTELAKINSNTAVDAGAQEAVHAEAALFYVKSCPGRALTGSMSDNSAERVTGTAIQTRVPPNDCYWTVAEVDDLGASKAGDFEMLHNIQVLGTTGAPVCLRPINAPGQRFSGSDCQSVVRELRSVNTGCNGSLADVWTRDCDHDVCLARLLGCPGTDPACNAATSPLCSNADDCALCDGTCGRPVFEPSRWFIVGTAVASLVVLTIFMCCCGCTLWVCVMAWPRHTVVRRKRRRAQPITSLDEKAAWRALVDAQQAHRKSL